MTQLSRASYDETKASEVAFYFLMRAKKSNMTITKLRLVKWMYLAERAAYEKFGEPLTGDALCSLKHGPVPSVTLRLIERPNQVASNGAWASVVETVRHSKHVYVSVTDNCSYRTADDLRRLSDDEVELLDDVWTKFGRMSSKDLETYLHDPARTPEWDWSEGDGGNPIELEDLFIAFGYSAEQTAQLVENIQALEGINASFH
ncbi:Panacea domain-containing protein [Achromobacter aegrifaciens]